MIAKCLGLPVERFIAATNINDTVPRYWQSGHWEPVTAVPTLSNAMDVSAPNNWPRIEEMFKVGLLDKSCLSTTMVDESDTQLSMRQMYQQGYTSEPHAAVAYKALQHSLVDSEIGVFLGTAHPAKFKDSVETVLSEMITYRKHWQTVLVKLYYLVKWALIIKVYVNSCWLRASTK